MRVNNASASSGSGFTSLFAAFAAWAAAVARAAARSRAWMLLAELRGVLLALALAIESLFNDRTTNGYATKKNDGHQTKRHGHGP